MQSDIKGRECESGLQSKSEREKDVINGAESKRLNENVTEKMCSSDGNVVGKMCSPADADTCGDRMSFVQTPRSEVSCECKT